MNWSRKKAGKIERKEKEERWKLISSFIVCMHKRNTTTLKKNKDTD
jgi:hypothetical protein